MQQTSNSNNRLTVSNNTYTRRKLDSLLVRGKTVDYVEFIDLDDEHVIYTVDTNKTIKRQWKQTGERLADIPIVFTVKAHYKGLGTHITHYEVVAITVSENNNVAWIETKCVETGATVQYQAKNWSNFTNMINKDNNNSYLRDICNFIEVVTGCKKKQGQKLQTKHMKFKSASEVLNSIHIEPMTITTTVTKEIELPHYENNKAIPMPPSCYQVIQTDDRTYGLTTEEVTFSNVYSGVYLWYSDFLRYIGESCHMIQRGMSESTGECLDKFRDMSLDDILQELQDMLDNGNIDDIEVTHLINLYESYQVPLLYFTGRYGYTSGVYNRKKVKVHTHFESIFISWNLLLEDRLDMTVINDKQRDEDILELLRTMPNTEFKLTDSVSELIDELVEPTQYELEVIEEYCKAYGYKWHRLDSDHAKLIVSVCRSLDMTVESLLFE